MRMDSLRFNHFRLRLSEVEALPQWVMLGLVSGLLSAAVILLFRLALEWPLSALLPAGAESFEQLPPEVRLLLPIAGSLVVGLLLWRGAPAAGVGVTHVLERLSYHQGRLPLPNLLMQFLGGVLMLGSGHSGGREGPAVHLGAGVSSLLGQALRLPNNSLRTLVGCGTAAAIAAAFNTPIAGIIFAMEVVMMEYTVAGFMPVLVAAISAALLTQLVLGDQAHLHVPPLDIVSLQEVPFIVLLGFAVGLLAVCFTRIALASGKLVRLPIVVRLLLAGIAVGVAAQWVPEIMGIGYDTLGTLLSQPTGFSFLCVLALTKLLVTAFSIGLGAPMGLIGPTLLIGAAAGAAIGSLGVGIAQQPVAEVALYAMLGMGAMMAATLQAPLAALLALLELTLNPNILFTGMLAIITATLVYRFCCPQGSVFQALMAQRGLDWRRAPLDHYLETTSIIALTHRLIPTPARHLSVAQAQTLCAHPADWLLISDDHGQPKAALARADLKLYLQQLEQTDPPAADQPLDLLEFPAQRRDVANLSIQATLKEALTQMNARNVDALCIVDLNLQPYGLLLRDEIERQFRRQEA